MPLYVLCQGSTSTGCNSHQAAHICVLICGHETRIFKVTRSESVIQHIINAERYFWECVENDTPLRPDASESAAKAMQQLYPQHVPLTVEDLSHHEQANQLFAQLIQENFRLKNIKNKFDETKHQIQLLMRDAERATFAKAQ